MSAKTQHHNAFTLVELLAVIAIISLLLSIALPGLNKARINARVAADKASLRNIGVAVEQFAGDIGHFPESGLRTGNEFSSFDTRAANLKNPLTIASTVTPIGTTLDQGAHRLYEALAGLDMMGYQKEHYYRVENATSSLAGKPTGTPLAPNKLGVLDETQRYGPYVDLESMKTSTMQKAHLQTTNFATPPTPGNTNPVFIGTLQRTENRPILYYKANRNNRALRDTLLTAPNTNAIYNYWDNYYITTDAQGGTPYHPDFDTATEFEDYTWDPDTGVDPAGNNPAVKIASPYARPYNKDTFILIHPGLDNLYGTADDITNYEVKPITSN